MPPFARKLLITLTGYSWVVLLAGVVLLSLAAWSQWKPRNAQAIAAREQLQSIAGTVSTTTNVTVKQHRKATQRYYEIIVNPDEDAEPRKLRLAHTTPSELVDGLIDEKITALFDPSNSNTAYEVVTDGKKIISYEDTQQHLLSEAATPADSSSIIGLWLLALATTVLAIAGMWLHRRMLAMARSEKVAAA